MTMEILAQITECVGVSNSKESKKVLGALASIARKLATDDSDVSKASATMNHIATLPEEDHQFVVDGVCMALGIFDDSAPDDGEPEPEPEPEPATDSTVAKKGDEAK